MPRSPLEPHAASPAEVRERLEAERRGTPFLVLRDGGDRQVLVPLADTARLTVGRSPDAGVTIGWDHRVSPLRPALERVGGEWAVSDDGLSRNGTWIGGERVTGRRRLRDGDAVRLGETVLVFRDPGATPAAVDPTLTAHDVPRPPTC
jgi:pSer/pThr/pTyr-binding forkhead associated (FHA) protein